MDRIAKLERSNRWHRLCILLLGGLWLLGAKAGDILEVEAVTAKWFVCDFGKVNRRAELAVDGEASWLNVDSPNGKNHILVSTSNGRAFISIKSGKHVVMINDDLIDILAAQAQSAVTTGGKNPYAEPAKSSESKAK